MVLVGDSGTGKSRLRLGIGAAITGHGLKVRCAITANLVNDLAEAYNEKRLPKTLWRNPAISRFLPSGSPLAPLRIT